MVQSRLGDIARAIELHRCRVFDAQRYRHATPDVPARDFAATLHFCRHGRIEQRVWNQPALGQWLAPHVLKGAVRANAVRGLLRRLETIPAADREARQAAVKAFCAEYALEFHEYLYHAHLHAQDYDAAYECLAHLPMSVAFLPYYRFARRHMKMDQLGKAFAHIRQELGRGADLGIEQLIAARDMAAALDYPDTDRVAFHQSLLGALARWPAPNMQARFRAMWQIGFPLVPGPDEPVDEIFEALPADLRRQLDPAAVQLPTSVQGYETILNLATLNGLKAVQRAVPLGAGFAHCVALDEVAAETCRLRVLGEGYWRQADFDPIQSSFLKAFKAASARAAGTFSHFYPVAATNIFDVRHSGQVPMPTLSYHSIASPDQRFLNFKESALPGYFKFDRQGFSGWEEAGGREPAAGVPAGQVEAAFAALRQQYVDSRVSKYEQPVGEVSGLPDRFVLAALQVPDDTVMSLASMTLDEWLGGLERACLAAGISLVVKAHPLDRSTATADRLARLQGAGPHVFVSQAAIHQLLDRALAVVTVNSGVGIEALLHLKPVIALGASEYAAVAHQVTCVDELLRTVEGVAAEAPDADWVSRVKAFLYGYCHERSFTLERFPEQFDEMLAALKRGG